MPARAMRRLPEAPRVRSGPSAAASVASVHQLYATSHDAYLEAELLRYHDPLAL